MARPNKLETMVLYPKRIFDANCADDLREYQYFLKNNKWRGVCPFLVEWPHQCIPDMIEEKILTTHLKNLIELVETKYTAKKVRKNIEYIRPDANPDKVNILPIVTGKRRGFQ